MSYLLLPPDELIKFAEDIKERYGLIAIERPARVELNPSKYKWVAWRKSYAFSYVGINGGKQPIIVQNGNGTILYASTQQQFDVWNRYKIVSEPMKRTFSRFIQCTDQIAERHYLISPAGDLQDLNQFLIDIFYEGENDG